MVPPVTTADELLDTDSATLLLLLDFLTVVELVAVCITDDDTVPSVTAPQDSAVITFVEASEELLTSPTVPLAMTTDILLGTAP